MGTKTFVILCVVIALLGIGVGVVLNTRPTVTSPAPLPPVTAGADGSELPGGNTPISFSALASPVIAPVQDTVLDIGENTMIVTGVNGEMTLPIDPSIVKLFRRQADTATPLPLHELKKGDSVEVHVIKPGELIHLFI